MCRCEPFNDSKVESKKKDSKVRSKKEDSKAKVLQKTFCTCQTIEGNSGCPIITPRGEVMGLLMQADGTSREIVTVVTIQLFLEEYLNQLVSIH
jgi:hypothetical protein